VHKNIQDKSFKLNWIKQSSICLHQSNKTTSGYTKSSFCLSSNYMKAHYKLTARSHPFDLAIIRTSNKLKHKPWPFFDVTTPHFSIHELNLWGLGFRSYLL
jgi:hypothetical protein